MDFIREFFLRNTSLKLVSLVAAVLLWMAIGLEPVREVAIAVPIENEPPKQDLVISSETASQVQVRVRGPAAVVHSLGPNDVHAVIDLSAATPGEHTYDLTAARIRVPRDVEVVQITPSQIRMSFDNRGSKKVEVRARVMGSSAPGFRLQDVKVDPEFVTIVGPAKRVEAIDAVTTDPVDASGVMGPATFTSHVYVSDPLVKPASSSTVHVTVVTESRGRSAASPHK
jgi:YbbR domain-containing protein